MVLRFARKLQALGFVTWLFRGVLLSCDTWLSGPGLQFLPCFTCIGVTWVAGTCLSSQGFNPWTGTALVLFVSQQGRA